MSLINTILLGIIIYKLNKLNDLEDFIKSK